MDLLGSKRQYNFYGIYIPQTMTTKGIESEEDDGPSFRDMGLDDRLLEAVAVKLSWRDPTDIQKRAIPLIMEGRDLMARGRTGSGKTGAFVIPIIQKILDYKRLGTGSNQQCTRALIMAPTKELCRQIQNVLKGKAYKIKEFRFYSVGPLKRG